MVQLACERCQAKLRVNDRFAGGSGTCPACGVKLKIPGTPPVAAAKDAAADHTFDAVDDDFAKDFAATKAPDYEESEGIPLDDDDDHVHTPIIFSDGSTAGSSAVSLSGAGLSDLGQSAVDLDAAGASSSGSLVSLSQPGREAGDEESLIAPGDIPPHLGHLNHYIICDHKEVVARWKNDGKGWMIRVKEGFARASQITIEFPSTGKFTMIEIGVGQTPDGLHLTHVRAYRLKQYYALSQLAKGDDAILGTITSHTQLNSRQRAYVRDLVAANFLPSVCQELDTMMP